MWCNILIPHRSICVVVILHCGFEAGSVGVYTLLRSQTWDNQLFMKWLSAVCVWLGGVLQQIAVGLRDHISNGLLVGRASLSPAITACQRPGVWLRLYRGKQATADSHWPKDQKASFWAFLITQLYFTKRISVCAQRHPRNATVLHFLNTPL